MMDFILCAVSNMFRIYLIYRFAEIFLGKNESGTVKSFLVGTCFYLTNVIRYWKFHMVWVNIACNLIGISVIMRLYTSSVKLNLFVTSSVYILNFGCDAVATILFIHYEDGEAFSQIYEVISVFLIFVCEIMTEKIITTYKHAEKLQNFPLIFIPVCSIAAIGIIIYTDTCQALGIAIISITLLIVNFFMLYLYNMLLHSISHKYEAKLLKQQVNIYSNQLNVILQSEEKVKSLRHDMKHHMNEIKLLANKYGITEIQGYIDNMEEFICNPAEIVSSGNLEIDSLLNYMLQKAREELKEVDVKVKIPEAIGHSFDINVILGNLLENALEAARQTEEKQLNVNIQFYQGIFKIVIENSYNGTLIRGKQGVITSKKEKESHGIGMGNVKKIVEKYGGIMEVYSHDMRFGVKLILYMPDTENFVFDEFDQ